MVIKKMLNGSVFVKTGFLGRKTNRLMGEVSVQLKEVLNEEDLFHWRLLFKDDCITGRILLKVTAVNPAAAEKRLIARAELVNMVLRK